MFIQGARSSAYVDGVTVTTKFVHVFHKETEQKEGKEMETTTLQYLGKQLITLAEFHLNTAVLSLCIHF